MGPGTSGLRFFGSVGAYSVGELLADAREGFLFALFVRDRPSWPRPQSGFRVSSSLDVDATFFASQGSGMVGAARRAAVRYESYFEAHKHLMRSAHPYDLVSGDVIASWLKEVAGASGAARGAADAGCSASALLTGLGYAHTLANAPFGPSLLRERRVLAATKAPVPKRSPQSAHLTLAAHLHIEDVALGSYWSAARSTPPPSFVHNEYVLEFARDCVILVLLSLRGVDGLRAHVLPAIPGSTRPILQTSTKKAGGARKGGGSKFVKFDAFIPEVGFLAGVDLWLPEWLAAKRGKPFFFRAFKSTRVGRPDLASAWLPKSMVKGHLEVAWAWLLSSFYSREESAPMQLSLHGPRHLLAEMARQLDFSKVERNELGRWAGSDAAASFDRSKVSSMSDLYAREGPAHDSELSVRLRVIARVSAFIGLAAWRDVVPPQRGEIASFSFLSPPEGRA